MYSLIWSVCVSNFFVSFFNAFCWSTNVSKILAGQNRGRSRFLKVYRVSWNLWTFQQNDINFWAKKDGVILRPCLKMSCCMSPNLIYLSNSSSLWHLPIPAISDTFQSQQFLILSDSTLSKLSGLWRFPILTNSDTFQFSHKIWFSCTKSISAKFHPDNKCVVKVTLLKLYLSALLERFFF